MNIHKNSVSKSLVPTNKKCNDLDFGELIKGKKIKRVRHITTRNQVFRVEN
jgi:hypothetical protein